MKNWLKVALFWLPAMVCVTLVGWIVLGALPGMAMTGDIVSWLLELPVITCYALATAGATMLMMQVTGLNLDNEYRLRLIDKAAVGDKAALNVLNSEAAAWCVFLVIFAVIFFPHW